MTVNPGPAWVRFLPVLPLVAALGTWAQGAEKQDAAGSPHIVFATTNYEFGRVVAGDVVKCRFTFTNTGTAQLEVTDVKSSCGCTSAGLWSHSVAPGKTGFVPVEFFTGKFTGPITKSLTVECNDPEQRTLTLALHGDIWRPIVVTPDSAYFTGLFEGTNAVRTLKIVNQEEKPLAVWEAKSNHRSIVSELRTNQPGHEYELVVKLVPPFGTGHIFGQVTMKTSSPQMPTLTAPVWAIAQPAVMTLPEQIELPAGPLTNPVPRSVSFRNNASSALKIFDPSLNFGGVELKLAELQPGKYFTVLLNFPAGFEFPAGLKPELTVKSNHPQFPIIKVPIVRPGPPPQAAAR